MTEPGMLEDVLEGGSIARPVFEAAQDQILALRGQPPRRTEVDYGAHDLVVLFEGNISVHHVVE